MLLVSSLEHGGAERQVLELYRSLDRQRFTPMICSLSDYVPLLDQRPEVRRDLVILRKRWKYDLSAIAQLARVVRERQISLVHAFLFDAEMTARSARRLGLIGTLVSSERNSDYALSPFKTWCLRRSRRWFDAMIANSAAGKSFNVAAFGVDSDRIHVIRNGIDVQRFRPTDGSAFRADIGVPPAAPLVGMVASFKKQKRHEDFFRAAKRVLDLLPEARFVCVGEPLRHNEQGASDYHREMHRLVAQLKLGDRLIFAGARRDMPEVYAACDVTVLPSAREGTPNALLESMACEVPVVATAVADNALVVPEGRTGFIVGVGEVDILADRLLQLLTNERLRQVMGREGRAWVIEEFSTSALATRTAAVYQEALRNTARGTVRQPRTPAS